MILIYLPCLVIDFIDITCYNSIKEIPGENTPLQNKDINREYFYVFEDYINWEFWFLFQKVMFYRI
jgi:hypothetical protein